MPQETKIEAAVSRWHALLAEGKEADAAELCMSCPDLLPEVQRRLAVLEQVNAVACTPPTLDHQSVRTAPTLPGVGVPPATSPLGYEILEELGRGGMGVVYKARHAALNRVVALKMILAATYAGPQELDRFRREAEAVASLQHPNIIQIFEVGTHQGMPYLSLEYCAAGSLDRKLDGTPLPPKVAAATVEKLARAMHAAHAVGIIHRDLKPANVLISPDGTPKITDFGLARRIDEQGMTAPEVVLGTPSYMPPEQARREAWHAAPAADVYSLGAILYECLTGRPPFRAATTVDTLMQVIHDEPVPPSRLNPKAPRDLETVCLKCLEKKPEKRYPSAEELADDLARWLHGEPIKARPAGATARSLAWVRRRPAVASLLGVLGGLTVAAITAISVLYGNAVRQAKEAGNERDRALAAEDRADRDRKRAEGQLAHARYADLLARAQRAENNYDPLRAAALLGQTDPALRGWEFGRIQLSNRTNSRAGSHPVEALSWSKDGSHLAAVRPGDWTRVWDVRTRKHQYLRRSPDPALCVALSPNGQLILAPEIGSLATREEAELSISTRGTKKRQLDEEVIEEVRTDEIGKKHPKNGTPAAADAASAALLLGSTSGKASSIIALPGEPVGIRFIRGGKSAFVLTRNGRLCLIEDTIKGGRMRVLFTIDAKAHGLAVAPSERLVACLAGKRIALIETDEGDQGEGKLIRWLEAGPDADFNSAAFSPFGESLLAGDTASGKACLWDVETGRLSSFQAARGPGRLTAVCWLPGDPPRIATADRLDGITIRKLDGGRIDHFPINCSGGEALAASPDGTTLAVGTSRGVSLVSLGGREPVVELEADGWLAELGPPARAGAALGMTVKDVIVDESMEKDGADGPETWLVRPKGLQAIKIPFDPRPSKSRRHSPDGKMLAVPADHAIELRDASTNELKAMLLGHTSPVLGVCFAPGGRLFSHAHGEIKVWSIDPGFPLLSMNLSTEIRGIAFDEGLDCLVLLHKDRRAQLLFASKREPPKPPE